MRVVVLGAGFGGLELTTQAVRGVRRRRRRRAHRQDRRLRLRVLEARRDVRARAPPNRCGTRTATSSSRACSSCSRRSARSTRRQARRDRRRHVRRRRPRRRARRRPPSRRRRRAWSRAATSSTPCAGAFALRDVLADFDGGRVDRRGDVDAVQVPAGAERDRAADARLPDRPRRARRSRRSRWSCRCRCRSRRRPTRPKALLAAFAERGIEWHPQTLVRALDPERQVALLGDGGEMPYDLFLGVPVHRAPAVVAESGLTRRRLDPGRPAHARDALPRRVRGRRRHQRRHAEGGRVRRGPGGGRRPTASARRSAAPASAAHYDGRGICYLEFGDDQVAKVDVTFLSGQAPHGALEGPSPALAGRQGRVRHQPHPALVRPHLALTSRTVGGDRCLASPPNWRA